MNTHPRHLPSPAERAAVHELIAQEEKRLRRLNSRTNYARSSKKAVQQERARIESVIANHKSFLAPVRAITSRGARAHIRPLWKPQSSSCYPLPRLQDLAPDSVHLCPVLDPHLPQIPPRPSPKSSTIHFISG
jgi:hypothetical protein